MKRALPAIGLLLCAHLGFAQEAAHRHADPVVWMLQADQFETTRDGGLSWQASAWAGRDNGRWWLRSEGEHAHGRTQANLEVLWGKPVNAWWDVVAGVRHDLGHGPDRTWLALGVQGLAPYKVEVQATAYLGAGGRSMLRAQLEYELLLTNRLILQPQVEFTLLGRDDPALRLGSGLAQSATGLRLRYEIRREFAPYLGYQWSHHYGRSADFARAAGEPSSDRGWVAGLRFWF